MKSYPVYRNNDDDENFYKSLPDDLKKVVDTMCDDLKRSQHIDGYVKALGEMTIDIDEDTRATGFLFECSDSKRGLFWISLTK